jgi:hypothetical protein
MRPSRTTKFSYKSRQFEVKAVPFEEGWKVRVFENGKPVTPAVYSVVHDTLVDANWSMKIDLVDVLMQAAQDDVKRGRVPLMPPPGEAIP